MTANARLRAALLGLVALAIAILAWRQFGPARTPSPQPPLESLAAANFHDFRDAFNADSQEARVILLLSPT
jgi:heme A synthase